jgi:hypothetical protein
MRFTLIIGEFGQNGSCLLRMDWQKDNRRELKKKLGPASP